MESQERNWSRLQRSCKRAPQYLLPVLAWIVLLPARAAQQPAANAMSHEPQVFTGVEIDHQFAKLAAQANAKNGGGSTVIGNYGSHNFVLSLRTMSGGAEEHAHFDDVIFVRQGKATLLTGGTIANGKTDSEGETRGSGIRGGVRHLVVAGDVIHIPAGTPHQLLLAPGEVFRAFVVKVRE